MIRLSERAAAVKPSATLAAGARAKQMKAEGIKVYDFCLGEPDFSTPEHICAAAVQAMKAGHTRYTPASGIPELRTAVAKRYKKAYDIDYEPTQVIVSNGAKHSLHNALFATVQAGDEVIIPTPYWVSYSDLVELTGAKPVLVSTSLEDGFKMTHAQLESAITPKSRVLMINSPSNPTGAVYSRDELLSLAKIAVERGLTVISDEIYENLIYGDAEPTCFPTLLPELYDSTIVISGVSKTYAMTGWRIGWTLGPPALIKAMGAVQSQQTGNPCSISQHAAVAALEGDQTCVATMKREFEARRDMVCKRLQAMPGVRCPVPEGAFYVFFDISAHFGRTLAGEVVSDTVTFCRVALEKMHVNIVPGSAFGAEGSLRMSYAASREELEEGLNRLEQLLAE